MTIHESAEDYLERILMLHRVKGTVRSIDIANDMGFSKPSISRAVKNLREDGYILVSESGNITLTEKGDKIARKILERHEVLEAILIELGVPKEIAMVDACKIEHDLEEITFKKIKEYYLAHTKNK